MYWLGPKKKSWYCRILLVGVIHSTLWRISIEIRCAKSNAVYLEPIGGCNTLDLMASQWLPHHSDSGEGPFGVGRRGVMFMHASFLLPPLPEREKKKLPLHYLFCKPSSCSSHGLHFLHNVLRSSYFLSFDNSRQSYLLYPPWLGNTS